MAIIKSAIELAMERTKNLVMDEEEKKGAARRELENRVKAILRRYLEEMIGKDDLQKEIDRLNNDNGPILSMLMDLIIDEVGGEKSEKLFELLETTVGKVNEHSLRELVTLKGRFTEQLERRGILVRQDILAHLRKMGVGGNAVIPNIEEWEEWRESMGEMALVFKDRLREWRGRVNIS